MSAMTNEARRQAIEGALGAHQPGDELLHLPWQDSSLDFEVVKVPVDTVLLNPRSHRIRAQLESHPEHKLVDEDPHSEKAQEIIAQILREGEGYQDLKTNLREVGQRDAGAITRYGLLVNANRRVVALRDLGVQYVRVAVLPANATAQEIEQLELSLQVAKHYQEDYTFTNELLFVDDLIAKYNRTPEQAALDLGWAASRDPKELKKGRDKVEEATRLYGLIRDIQHRSDDALRLTDFDEKRVHLQECVLQYQQLKAVDPEKARRVLDLRLLGIVTGVQYRRLRAVDENFLLDYLLPEMKDSDVLSGHMKILTVSGPDGDKVVPGLDILGDESAEEEEPDPATLLELMAKSAEQSTVELPSDEGADTVDREAVRKTLQTTFETAAEQARLDDKQYDKLNAPIEHLRTANRLLERALEGYQKVASTSGFKRGKFQFHLKKVTQATKALKSAL